VTVKINLPYLVSDIDRHLNRRWYVRRNGRKIRIRHDRASLEFLHAYRAAVEALSAPEAPGGHRFSKTIPGTLGWLAARYLGSDEFQRLNAKSQATRRAIIEDCLLEPLKPGSKDVMAGCPLTIFSTEHLQVLRDRKKGFPGAANNRLKYFSSMLGWGVEKRDLKSNPARDVRRIKYSSDGFHTWTVEEVRQFEKHHPIGTKARLALALLLFLGVRRGDAAVIGPQQVNGDTIRFTPRKTNYMRKEESVKVILPVLARIIAASPVGKNTFLVTSHGRPFSDSGLGNWFRERCDEAGLPKCSAHGLRKAGAALAAEAGATDRQLMALYDWTSEKQANVYTKAASKRLLAASAALLLGDQMGNESVPPDCPTFPKPLENQ
jgi:integrase